MHNEENQEDQKDERNICPQCGIRQYGSVCGSCNIELENEEEDPDKRKEDEYDEYDYRERR